MPFLLSATQLLGEESEFEWRPPPISVTDAECCSPPANASCPSITTEINRDILLQWAYPDIHVFWHRDRDVNLGFPALAAAIAAQALSLQLVTPLTLTKTLDLCMHPAIHAIPAPSRRILTHPGTPLSSRGIVNRTRPRVTMPYCSSPP